jgi:hypothetical protein
VGGVMSMRIRLESGEEKQMLKIIKGKIKDAKK